MTRDSTDNLWCKTSLKLLWSSQIKWLPKFVVRQSLLVLKANLLVAISWLMLTTRLAFGKRRADERIVRRVLLKQKQGFGFLLKALQMLKFNAVFLILSTSSTLIGCCQC